MEVFHFVFGIFGNATALFLFLSPMCGRSASGSFAYDPYDDNRAACGHSVHCVCRGRCIDAGRMMITMQISMTFKRIIKNKTTEEFSGVPYNMTLLNCLLSAWYGLPFVSPNNMLVWTINGTGAVIEAVYVLVFLAYAPPKTRVRMMGLLALVATVFGGVAIISVLVLHGSPRKLFCGLAATIFSICMYASPLSIMRLVIRTKSVEYMPFFLSLFVFLCGTSWFIYGLLGRDVFITVPNGCGSALGALQLILYAVYRNHKRPPGATAADSGVEMDGKPRYHQNGGEWRTSHSAAVSVDDKV